MSKPGIRGIEREFERKLRRIASHIGELIGGFDPLDSPEDVLIIEEMMARYSASLHGWAKNTTDVIIHRTNKKDMKYWEGLSEKMSRQMRQTLKEAPMSVALDAMQREQIELIKSLPTEAAARVRSLTEKAAASGERASEIASDLQRTTEVTKSRATLIARTEVARTASTLTETRAQAVGSTHYIWRTSGDSDVRHGHKAMNGKVCEWASPPAVDEGPPGKPRIMHHHPGKIWNCRCYPEPIFDED